jgi:hypothetical protein
MITVSAVTVAPGLTMNRPLAPPSRPHPAHFLRHQRARAAHLALHLAALHGIDPDLRSTDFRRRRLDRREAECECNEGGDAGADIDQLATAFLGFQIGA